MVDARPKAIVLSPIADGPSHACSATGIRSSFASSMPSRARSRPERPSTPSSTTTPPQAPKVIQWLGRHPRWTFHFTPTSASWLNAVEGFFAVLTKRRLKHGVFKGVADLQAAINRFLIDHNHQPKPFVWTADPDKIIAAASRGRQVLDSIH
jgi:hypothetical protein